MSGAWELREKKNVLIGILHTDVVPMAWALGYANLIRFGGYDVLPVAGMPYDMARNTLNQAALDGGYDHVFHLDSDVVTPSNAIARLLAHNKPIVSGVYYRRSPPASVPVMIKNGQWLVDFPPNRLIEVDWCGAGCLLLRRDALESIPPTAKGHRWFHWRVNYRGAEVYSDDTCMSEDFTFMQHAKRSAGIPTLVDTSILCRHVGYGEARQGVPPGCLIPAEATPLT